MTDDAQHPPSDDDLRWLSVHALVVDDEPAFARQAARALGLLGVERVSVATDAAAGLSMLDGSVGLLLSDMCLDQADGFERLVQAARDQVRAPKAGRGLALQHVTIIAMTGAASRAAVFQLNRLGVTAFLEKPFGRADLRACLSRATRSLDGLEQAARAAVGSSGARDAQLRVRTAMFQEALARTEGNRHAAARLLGVDRRLVQLRAAELDGDGREDNADPDDDDA